jgi:hypothetical protein
MYLKIKDKQRKPGEYFFCSRRMTVVGAISGGDAILHNASQ